MNERIRQLAQQAGMNIVDDKFSTYGKFAEKFAELIVKECVTLADTEAERYSNLDQEYCSMAMDNYRELVLKHFGVEE